MVKVVKVTVDQCHPSSIHNKFLNFDIDNTGLQYLGYQELFYV